MIQFAINLKTFILGPLWGLFVQKPQKEIFCQYNFAQFLDLMLLQLHAKSQKKSVYLL